MKRMSQKDRDTLFRYYIYDFSVYTSLYIEPSLETDDLLSQSLRFVYRPFARVPLPYEASGVRRLPWRRQMACKRKLRKSAPAASPVMRPIQ